MKFMADDTRRGDFDIKLELAEKEKDSLEEAVTNLSVGLAGVVAELLHQYCRTREDAARLMQLIVQEQSAALELYISKFFPGEKDGEEEQSLEDAMEEIFREAWFKDSPYESEEALRAAYAGQEPVHLDAAAEGGVATVFLTNRAKREVLGQVETGLAHTDPEAFETQCGMYQMVATVFGDKLYGAAENPLRTLYFGALRDKIRAMAK